MPLTIGDFDFAAVLALSIPIFALLIPVVAILTQHQRKMAEIIHGGQSVNPQLSMQIEAMRQEIQQLRQQVHQQAIAIDSMRSLGGQVPPVAPSEDVRFRLGEA